jgi:hypothetical protein
MLEVVPHHIQGKIRDFMPFVDQSTFLDGDSVCVYALYSCFLPT